jgi:hypothetical protein
MRSWRFRPPGHGKGLFVVLPDAQVYYPKMPFLPGLALPAKYMVMSNLPQKQQNGRQGQNDQQSRSVPENPKNGRQWPLKALLFIIILLSLLLTSSRGYSQGKEKVLPEHGFWQLVNEKGQHRTTVVQFYTDDRELMYQEQVKGVKFNLKKARTFRWLKEGLDKALLHGTSGVRPPMTRTG